MYGGGEMRIEEVIKVLSEFTLFKELNNYELGKISDIAITREWKKQSHIFLQGDPLRKCLLYL